LHETDWQHVPTDLFGSLLPDVDVFTRFTFDGELRAVRRRDDGRWVLSVTHTRLRRPRRRERVPNWWELSDARWQLLPENATVVLRLDSIDADATTLHLREL